MARRIRARLPLDHTAAARARQFLAPLVDELDPSSFDSVRLLVSELVSNSVKHSGRPAGDPILLTVDLRGSGVRAEVVDRGGGLDPLISPSPGSVAGWGLYLVNKLADDWGYSQKGPTRVWFEVNRRHTSPPTKRPAPRFR